MKKRKLLALSLATASLLTLSGCSNCKFCDWVSSCCKGAKEKVLGKGDADTMSKKIAAPGIVSIKSNADFQALIQSENPVVVKLHAPWCGACEEMNPVFQALAGQLPGITFAALDIDKVSEVAKEYGIQGVPTFLMFKNGKEVMAHDRVIGVIGQEKFKEILEEALLK